VAYDRTLRRALSLPARRQRVRCPHLRRVPRGRGNPAGAACAARAGRCRAIPTLTEYWELCSRSAHVYCPTYLGLLCTPPPRDRAVG
jgi:hypothetical protein